MREDLENKEDAKKPAKTLLQFETFTFNVNDLNNWEETTDYDIYLCKLMYVLELRLFCYPYNKRFKYETKQALENAVNTLKAKLEAKNTLFL